MIWGRFMLTDTQTLYNERCTTQAWPNSHLTTIVCCFFGTYSVTFSHNAVLSSDYSSLLAMEFGRNPVVNDEAAFDIHPP